MKIITLSNGKKLTVQSIPPLLMQRINDNMPDKPQPPTYEAKTAGDDVEIIPHNATTLTTDEDKAAWAEYQARLAEWNAEQSKRFLRAFFSRGIKIDLDAAALEQWSREMTYLGVKVPQGDPNDPEVYIERQVLYIETEYISSGDDMVTIMREIMRLTGVDEGEVAAATRLFQRSVEGDGDNSGDAG